MIKLDNVEENGCVLQNADDPTLCDDVTTNPVMDLSVLVLKPEFATVEAGSQVKYSTFLVSANGTESEVTMGLLYKVVDPGIGIVGASSGNATGVSPGTTMVTVEWQDLIAYAQLEVVDDCVNRKVGLVILLDNSKSMKEVFSVFPVPGGSTPSPSRFIYAKHVAQRVAGEINPFKDVVGAIAFNESPDLISGLSDDPSDVQDLINTITATENRTNLASGLTAAIDLLDSDATVDTKVIMLFTDGENKLGDPSLDIAEAFKQSGGYIAVLGARVNNSNAILAEPEMTSGKAFSLLSRIASDGMLVNAKQNSTEQSADYMSAMKSLFCAGNCTPDEGTTVYTPQLNFEGLINWDSPAAAGPVDLIGDGGNGAAAYDLLPGNGMYLDMVGSSAPWAGRLESKDAFTFDVGVNYRFSCKVAGHNRAPGAGLGDFTIRVTIGTMLDFLITISDWQQDFTLYSDDFVGDGTDQTVLIVVESGAVSSSYGPLMDVVIVENLDTPANLLYDDFDNENPIVQPPCGQTDCYGTGCLEEAIPPQTADSSVLPDNET